MLTAKGDTLDRVQGLNLGADDYLAKPFEPSGLSARIRAILRRTRPKSGVAPDARLKIADVELDLGVRSVWRNAELVELTSVEFDILAVLMAGAGSVVSRESLMRTVLGRDFSPFDRSIDTHIYNLRKKIGTLPDGAERIKGIRGAGYRYAFREAMRFREVTEMRSLFLRIFLWLWLTVVLVGAAFTLAARQGYTGSPALRESLFSGVLPAEAKESARILESSGGAALDRHLEALGEQFPIQTFFFTAYGDEVQGVVAAPPRVRSIARLSLTEDRSYEIVNLAARRADGPSGSRYALVMLQEPSDRYRRLHNTEAKRLFMAELPAIILVASGLFCYFSARHVTRPDPESSSRRRRNRGRTPANPRGSTVD